MPQWEVWLVPLIAMAVWILGSLLRGGAEERKRGSPRADAGDRLQRRPQQRSQSDLERFLEDVHRRRQGTEEPSTEGPPPVAVEPARTKPVAPRRVPAPPVVRKPKPKPPAVRATVAEVVAAMEAALPVALPVNEAVGPASSSKPAPRASPKQAASPALMAMLRTPAALRNAIILQEIFDPPLCRRRRP